MFALVTLPSKVSQRLNPQISIQMFLLRTECFALANFKHFFGSTLLNVEIEEFLSEVILFTRVLNALLRIVYLE